MKGVKMTITEYLEKIGWVVIRFWGNEIKKDVKYCVDIVQKVVENK